MFMSSIYEKVRKGQPLDDVLIIDGHCHMGHWFNFNIPDGSAESMLVTMNALGVNMSVVTAHPGITGDYRYANDMAMAAAKKYPDRFIAYASINPNYPEDMKNELDRCFASPGTRAIKFHPSCHGFPVDHKNYRVAYEMADEKQLPVLIHVWGKADVADVDRLAGRYPGVQFIIGHSGAEIRAMENCIDVINRHKNCYADLAISLAREGNVEWLAREVGSNRVTYGTDTPFFDSKPAFARVAYAEISDDDKRNIYGLNIKKLLKL
jgi:uncharacterized protein